MKRHHRCTHYWNFMGVSVTGKNFQRADVFLGCRYGRCGRADGVPVDGCGDRTGASGRAGEGAVAIVRDAAGAGVRSASANYAARQTSFGRGLYPSRSIMGPAIRSMMARSAAESC
jgi:hypothetical protein